MDSILTYLTIKRGQTHTTKLDEQIKVEQERHILRRVMAMICLLAERGLAFRGDGEIFGSPNNGNFLGLLELIAKFDTFLMKEIKESGYFSVSVDSTPDVSNVNVDQLTVIVRYVSPLDGIPVERFLTFIELKNHAGEGMAELILNFFEELEIDFSKCRGQSYDNAANMAKLKRTGWVLRNVQDPETVSGHMYRMAILSMLIPTDVDGYQVNKDKCIKIALVHDMAESIDAMLKLQDLVGGSVGQELYDLWHEYEHQTSKEANLVKDLDKFDMILQAYEYEQQDKRPSELQEFFDSTEGNLFALITNLGGRKE
ncbi:HD domain-containing protein 2 [Nymphon striatum]|nr:HD domain-containing protein 2 [Nymphon striatum]